MLWFYVVVFFFRPSRWVIAGLYLTLQHRSLCCTLPARTSVLLACLPRWYLTHSMKLLVSQESYNMDRDTFPCFWSAWKTSAQAHYPDKYWCLCLPNTLERFSLALYLSDGRYHDSFHLRAGEGSTLFVTRSPGFYVMGIRVGHPPTPKSCSTNKQHKTSSLQWWGWTAEPWPLGAEKPKLLNEILSQFIRSAMIR